MLEHLASPGLLSRDLVATHPNFTYTIYDEAALFLSHAQNLDLRKALLLQQILFRAAAVLGVFLLARSIKLGVTSSLAVAAAVNFVGTMPGPDVAVTELEAAPNSFAFGLVLLAIGLFANEKPLLAGLMGGLALVYDARVAAPFWIIALAAFFFDRRARPVVKASLTVLVVFALLLANLAQLQPAVGDTRSLLDRIPGPIATVQQLRTPDVWISLWPVWQILLYVVVAAFAFWAYWLLASEIPVMACWFCGGLPVIGLISLPASRILEHERLYALPQIQPPRALLFTVAMSCFLAIDAAVKFRRARPLLAVAALFIGLSWHRPVLDDNRPLEEVAEWASANTWGGSMFLFPDAGRGFAPGMFRAEARRAVWVDWGTGTQSDYFDTFADEWWRRWRDTMQPAFTPSRLENLLSLPIDYYVLKPSNRISDVKPAFENAGYLVYDAHDLKRPD